MAGYTMQTDKTEAQTRKEIVEEFARWNTSERGAVESFDFPAPETIGSAEAVLRFKLRGLPVIMRCSSQLAYRLNLRCLFYAVESMRMNEKRGIADVMRQAYGQLSAPTLQRDPYEVLGVRSDTELEDIEAMYKRRAMRLHPDTGGADDTAMKELNGAIERIREERRVPAGARA